MTQARSRWPGAQHTIVRATGAIGLACVVALAGACDPPMSATSEPTTPAPPKGEPTPSKSEPTKPEPAKPEPAKPEPAKPEPATPTSPPTKPAPPADGSVTAPKGESLPTIDLTLGGREFTLELALTDKTRFRGLSGRAEIPEAGGLVFVFRREQSLQFVMRDCPVPIDIIYVDKSGRITAMHNMEAEPPRKDDEKLNRAPFPGAPEWSWTNDRYEARLRKYPSRFGAIIAIELRGGTLDLGDNKQVEGAPSQRIKLKVGDKIEGLDVPALVKRAE
jgi:uncharacterized membrane protein (UPF0127 family)